MCVEPSVTSTETWLCKCPALEPWISIYKPHNIIFSLKIQDVELLVIVLPKHLKWLFISYGKLLHNSYSEVQFSVFF